MRSLLRSIPPYKWASLMPIYNRGYRDANGHDNPAGLHMLGPVDQVEIHVPDAIAKVLSDSNLPIPPPQVGLALIDTGATFTAVHEPALQALGLNPVGVVQTGTANGPIQQSQYPAKMSLPGMGFAVGLNQVTGCNLSNQTIPMETGPAQLIALIGRDILKNCVLTYNGPAGFWSLAL